MKHLLLSILFLAAIFTTYSQQLFQKTFGSTGTDQATSVAQTKDSGYIMVGNTNSFGVPFTSIYIVKFDKTGNQVWNKTFGGSIAPSNAECIAATKDGGCIIGGNGSDTDPYHEKGLLIKLDADGTLQWVRFYKHNNHENYITTVIETKDGGYAFAGWGQDYETSETFGAGYIHKTDSEGNIEWARELFFLDAGNNNVKD